MKKLLLALLLLIAIPAQAAFILQCDPYPTSVIQPDGFTCTFAPLGGAPALVKSFTAVKLSDGSVILQADLSVALPAGAYINSSCVATKSTFANSGQSNTIAQFVIGTLSAPGGLIIIIK